MKGKGGKIDTRGRSKGIENKRSVQSPENQERVGSRGGEKREKMGIDGDDSGIQMMGRKNG